MAVEPKGPAVPIDLTRLPQFAPEPPPRSGLVVAALSALCAALCVMGFLVSQNTETFRKKPVSETVSRAFISETKLPKIAPVQTAQPVSLRIRQPLRIIDRDVSHLDLNHRVGEMLTSFGYSPAPDDRLSDLLIGAVAKGKSDAFIHAVLRAGYVRGEFALPPRLLTETGDVDTQRMLQALVAQNDR